MCKDRSPRLFEVSDQSLYLTLTGEKGDRRRHDTIPPSPLLGMSRCFGEP